jgi:hypothetical protein
MPSASSLASGGLGSGGSLPSSIPGASLLPNPIPGNYRSQVAQGQALFQAAQNAAAGTPGSVATLLQGAATVATSNMAAGLPKTLITDAAGIAAGFAIGGPVGGAVAIAGAALGFVTSLFSGPTPTVFEGFEAYPSDASVRNWTLIQNYIANLVGASESGYPPGWYLAYYMAASAPKYTTSDLTDLFLLTAGSFATPGGDTSALFYLNEEKSGALQSLNLPVRYLPSGDPKTLAGLVPWKGNCAISKSGAVAGTCFQVFQKTQKSMRHALDAWWSIDGVPTIPLAYLWGAPTGAGLPGSLGQGYAGVTTPGTPTVAQITAAYPGIDRLLGGIEITAPSLQTLQTIVDFDPNLASAVAHPFPPGMGPKLPAIWSQALSDISDKPGMTRASIAARMLKLTPRNIWFDPSLYTMFAVTPNHTSFEAIYNLDILNALATIWTMSACGAHPRAITTELLVQQANIYEHGGPNPGVQNLSLAYRRFMDEWLNISQGFAPDTHVPVLGQMSSDAPPEAHATHAANLSTLAQWVQHYLA